MNNTALNTLDINFTILEKISEIDYVALGETAIKVTATATAIVTGIVSYVWLALQLWWDEYNEVILVNSVRFTVGVVDFAGSCYFAGRKLRPVANGLVASLTDRVYYLAAGY